MFCLYFFFFLIIKELRGNGRNKEVKGKKKIFLLQI